MEIIIRRQDIYVVAIVLFIFFGWVAHATYENHDVRASLKDLAQDHIDEWFATEPGEVNRENFDYLAIVDMDRPYELFGPAFGVVHVYIREAGDEACETFKGIEYYYRLEEDGWRLEHSAGCAAKEHHIRAFQHYLTEGAGVNDAVFDQALGLEFEVAQAEEYLQARKEGRNPYLARHTREHHRDGDSDHHDDEETGHSPHRDKPASPVDQSEPQTPIQEPMTNSQTDADTSEKEFAP